MKDAMLGRLLGSRLRGRLLGWLLTHPDQRYFVRQLGAILGEDSTNVSRELARLADIGVLTTRTEGRQKYYQANPDCAVFDELRGLAAKTTGVVDILRASLAGLGDRIKLAVVFGSMARGQERADSDIDLMIVGEVSFGEVVAALGPAQARLGREVNPTVYSPAEFRRKVRLRHHFLKTVLKNKFLFVIGGSGDLGRLG